MPPNEVPPASGGVGLSGSLQRLADTVLEIGQVRLELLGTEIEEQKQRLLGALLWAVAGLALLTVGLAVLASAVLAMFWDSARGTAFAALLLVYLGVGAWALWRARGCLRTPGGAFAASAAELASDRAALSPGGAGAPGGRSR